MYKVQMT